MSIRLTQPANYSDLGDIWLRDHLARLTQKHLQLGRHYRMDADALITRLASAARAAKAAAVPTTASRERTDHIRRATVEAVEHCSRFEIQVRDVEASVIAC